MPSLSGTHDTSSKVLLPGYRVKNTLTVMQSVTAPTALSPCKEARGDYSVAAGTLFMPSV